MAVTVRNLGSNVQITNLVPTIREIFGDLEDQLNERAQIYVSTDGRIPTNLARNDILIVAYKGRISISVKSAKSFLGLTAAMLGGLSANSHNFLGLIRGTAAPALTNFPNPGDFGFYFKTTATVHRYLCVNIDNVLYKVEVT